MDPMSQAWRAWALAACPDVVRDRRVADLHARLLQQAR
jgi:hypothetical protein